MRPIGPAGILSQPVSRPRAGPRRDTAVRGLLNNALRELADKHPTQLLQAAEAKLREVEAARSALEQERNGYREIVEETERIVASMSPAVKFDLVPDWLEPRIAALRDRRET